MSNKGVLAPRRLVWTWAVGGLMIALTAALLVPAYAQEQEAAATPPGVVAYWMLNETSGSTFADAVGSNAATCGATPLPACPTPDVGRVAGAQNFGAGTGLSVADNASLDFANNESFSVEAWIKTPMVCAQNNNKVFVGKSAGSGNASWWLGCTSTATLSNVATFSVRDANDVAFVVRGTTPINDNQWHHIVGIRDAAANNLRVYVDGALQGTMAATYTGDFNTPNPLTIGYYQNVGGFQTTGNIDEVAVWRKALTQAEITEHRNRGMEGQPYFQPGPGTTLDKKVYLPLVTR